MLAYAGKNILKFSQKTASVRSAYKTIETAKMECLKEEPVQ